MRSTPCTECRWAAHCSSSTLESGCSANPSSATRASLSVVVSSLLTTCNVCEERSVISLSVLCIARSWAGTRYLSCASAYLAHRAGRTGVRGRSRASRFRDSDGGSRRRCVVWQAESSHRLAQLRRQLGELCDRLRSGTGTLRGL